MSRIILITGASTGLGASTALELAADNKLLLHYNRSEDEAENVAREVKNAGGEAYLMQADLTSEAGCRSLLDQTIEHTHQLDILVNNAGGLIKRQAIPEYTWAFIEETFRLNTFSAMFLASIFLPLLKKGQDPQIIFISSIVARTGAPSATIYGAAKGAIDTVTRGAAKELAPEIRVNAVAPGVIDTPFHEKVSSPERMKVFKENTALKRIGEAHHISQAVRFLIENDYITGETIDVNGGMFMR